MKNILYLSNTGRMIGGGEISLLQLVEHLDQSKYRPLTVSPEKGAFSDKLQQAGIPTAILPMPSLRGVGLIQLPRTVLQLLGLTRKHEIDLLHANGSRSMIYGGLTARCARLPILWHVRIMDREPLLDFFLGMLATRIIANSAATANRFRHKALRRKVTVIHNGVDVIQFNPKVDGSKIRQEFSLAESVHLVTIVGRMDKWKGHRFFLEAAKQVLQQHGILNNRAATMRERQEIETIPAAPSRSRLRSAGTLKPRVKFLLVGDGPERPRLEQLSQNLGIANQVIFAGYREDIPQILAASDLLVSASLGEHFGRVLIEAMAVAKPVIATRAGGVPEIVADGETGILVTPGNAREMADAMMSLMGNRQSQKTMGRAGRARVEKHFAIEAHAREVEKIYDSL